MNECKTDYSKFGMCDTSRGPDGCYLIKELRDQAVSGGLMSPTERKGSGPYWSTKAWNAYMKRLETASKNGCACATELLTAINNITNNKVEKNELF